MVFNQQVEESFDGPWRIKLTYVAKYGDDLWFRGERSTKLGDSWFFMKSIEVERIMFMARGRALNGLGWPKAWPTPRKLRIVTMILYIQTLGAKIQSREGNSPNRTLRSLSNYLMEKLMRFGAEKTIFLLFFYSFLLKKRKDYKFLSLDNAKRLFTFFFLIKKQKW